MFGHLRNTSLPSRFRIRPFVAIIVSALPECFGFYRLHAWEFVATLICLGTFASFQLKKTHLKGPASLPGTDLLHALGRRRLKRSMSLATGQRRESHWTGGREELHSPRMIRGFFDSLALITLLVLFVAIIAPMNYPALRTLRFVLA